MTRRLVYTTLFDDFDYVLPPMAKTQGCDFVLFTDNPSLRVDGWDVRMINIAAFPTSRAANRYYKTCIADILPGYDTSLYIDANIRIKASLDDLFESFEKSEAGLGVYRHPVRQSVAAEVVACQTTGKISNQAKLEEELALHAKDGFPDTEGLIEATIMFKAHQQQNVRDAMRLWNQMYQRFLTRDQISLPYVIWKTGVTLWFQDHNFRNHNPYFALYPHKRATNVNPCYAYVSGRSHDSLIYRMLLKIWHLNWSAKRLARSAMKKVN